MRNLILQTGTGNVAIGDTGVYAPAQKLTVVGAIGATGDICTSTGGVSKCLSSLAPHGSSKFTSNGTWKAPTGVTAVYVTALGGGGGGGGNTTWNGACADSGGGGGGAGAFAFKNLVSVTPETVYSVEVGAGGAGGPVTGTVYSDTAGAGGSGGYSGLYTSLGNIFYVSFGKGGKGVNGACNAAGGAGGTGAGSGNIYLADIVAGANGSPATGTTTGGAAGVSTYGSPSYGSGGKGAAAASGGNVKGSPGQSGFVLIEW